MRCKVRVLGFDKPASDGSVITYQVVEEYLRNPDTKKELEAHRMLGGLTHRARNILSNFPGDQAANIKKTAGSDDSLLMLDSNCPPTHYVDKLWIEDGALWAEAQILDEEGFDDKTVQAIRRVKGLLKQTHLPISCVIVGYWNSNKNGQDFLQKLVRWKGFDWTLNNSFSDSYVTNVMDDDGNEIKTFSEVEIPAKSFDGYKVKTFSDSKEFGVDAPKTSKINDRFTTLKAKSFSIDMEAIEVLDEEPAEKSFSAATVTERVRIAKLSPRERFRRIILDYRQSLKAQGGIGKIDPETLKVMKSLFASDILDILKTLTPLVLKGKNLNSLLNAGSLGVEVRKATQALFIPYKQALMEVSRQGFVSKARYSKITAAYSDFIRALQDYVFGTPVDKKLVEEEESDGEN